MRNVQSDTRWVRTTMACVVASALTACGGGSDGGGSLITARGDDGLASTKDVPGAVFLSNVTSPVGIVRIASKTWIADHALGLCMVNDAVPATSTTPAVPATVNTASCVLGAAAPGQIVYHNKSTTEAPGGYVYLTDTSSKSLGVYRVAFKNDGTRNTAVTPKVITGGLSGARVQGLALNVTGTALFISTSKDGNLWKLPSPDSAAPPRETIFGKSTERVGPLSMAVMPAADGSSTLFMTEKSGAVTQLPSVDSCQGACSPRALGKPALDIPAATFVYADRTASSRTVYFGDAQSVYRFEINPSDCQGNTKESIVAVGYQNITAIGLFGTDLYVGHDPTAGGTPPAGQFTVIANADKTAVASGTCGAAPPSQTVATTTPPPTTTPGGTTTPTPIATAYARGNLTNPAGFIKLSRVVETTDPATGTTTKTTVLDIWSSDHFLGLCRLDSQPGAVHMIEPQTCVKPGASAGQAVVETGRELPGGRQYVYLPDNSATGHGIYRLTYDPATGLIDPASALLMPNGGAGGGIDRGRPFAVAIGRDGNLYTALGRNSGVYKFILPPKVSTLTNPDAVLSNNEYDPNFMLAPQWIGTVKDVRKGASSMTLVFDAPFDSSTSNGDTLVLAENANGVTAIRNIGACAPADGITVKTPRCIADTYDRIINTLTPVVVASDGGQDLYVADLGGVGRYTFPAGTTPSTYKAFATLAAPDTFQNIAGIGFGKAGPAGTQVFIGDDPTAGNDQNQGRAWTVAP